MFVNNNIFDRYEYIPPSAAMGKGAGVKKNVELANQ